MKMKMRADGDTDASMPAGLGNRDILFDEAKPGFKTKPKTIFKIKLISVADAEWITTHIEKEQRNFRVANQKSNQKI